MFIWPTNVRTITSHFRTESRPNHAGIDIAKPGHHQIFASASGIVTRSYLSESYGECMMILHSIDGDTYETVYAHMRSNSRRFKINQRVKQGQPIGVMGNTGRSTGQHLHFEIHKGRWSINKENSVNPLPYIYDNRETKEEKKLNLTYIVKKGDTLSSIASKFQTSIKQLVDLNNIKNRDLIYPGQILSLADAASNKYIVQSGDTLTKIAKDHKTTIDQLVRINKIRDKDLIQIGDVLTIS